jgi:hypothetical protein
LLQNTIGCPSKNYTPKYCKFYYKDPNKWHAKSNYIKGFVPGSKKKKKPTLRWDFLGGNFFRANFLNGIFLIKSFLP